MDTFLHYVLHLDVDLAKLVAELGVWAYGAIFAVIFSETGLVVAPWLPGESLLLTSGTLAGAGILEILVLAPLLFAAAFLGDLCNYGIGRLVGRRLLAKPRRHLRPEHIEQAHEFYERYGGFAIVFARFLPIVRTLAPFVAGVARLELHRLVLFASIASALWVSIFLGAGYFFGAIEWVQRYLAFALVAIVLASMTPGLVVYLIHRIQGRSRA